MRAQGTSTTLPKLQFNVQAKYIALHIRETVWSGGYRRGLGTKGSSWDSIWNDLLPLRLEGSHFDFCIS